VSIKIIFQNINEITNSHGDEDKKKKLLNNLRVRVEKISKLYEFCGDDEEGLEDGDDIYNHGDDFDDDDPRFD
jgi:hypothetical protein